MLSYAMDHLFEYSRHLLLLLTGALLGCSQMALSESTPLRLLNGELGLSRAAVNQSLIRRHRKGLDCQTGAEKNEQTCVFTATEPLPLSLAGRPVTEIHYQFIDNQLTRVSGHFAPDSEPDGYREKMQQRYGKPDECSSQQVRWYRGTQLLSLNSDSVQLEKIPVE